MLLDGSPVPLDFCIPNNCSITAPLTNKQPNNQTTNQTNKQKSWVNFPLFQRRLKPEWTEEPMIKLKWYLNHLLLCGVGRSECLLSLSCSLKKAISAEGNRNLTTHANC